MRARVCPRGRVGTHRLLLGENGKMELVGWPSGAERKKTSLVFFTVRPPSLSPPRRRASLRPPTGPRTGTLVPLLQLLSPAGRKRTPPSPWARAPAPLPSGEGGRPVDQSRPLLGVRAVAGARLPCQDAAPRPPGSQGRSSQMSIQALAGVETRRAPRRSGGRAHPARPPPPPATAALSMSAPAARARRHFPSPTRACHHQARGWLPATP